MKARKAITIISLVVILAFGIAAVVRWNLFNSGADVAESKAAAARIRQARQSLYDYMDELKLNVEESWTQYVSAQEQLAFYKEAIEYNIATRDAYQEQFVLGERSLLDVLDAESELFNSSTQAATALGNRLPHEGPCRRADTFLRHQHRYAQDDSCRPRAPRQDHHA